MLTQQHRTLVIFNESGIIRKTGVITMLLNIKGYYNVSEMI